MYWNVDRTLSSVEIFSYCSNIEEFRNWLKNFPEINENKIFPGYKFFLKLNAVLIIDSLVRENAFRLHDSEPYHLAISRGITLEDIPNDCEKVVFLKNIWKYFEYIESSKNWQELKDNVHKSHDVIVLLKTILEKVEIKIEPKKGIKTKSKRNFSRIEIIKFLNKKYVLTYLNDTSRGVPQGAIANIIPPFIDSPEPSFEGYVYSLQFLWSKLLRDVEYNKSPAKDIHSVKSLLTKEECKRLDEEFNTFHENEYKAREWYLFHGVLDTFFGKIYEAHIENFENQLNDFHLIFSCGDADSHCGGVDRNKIKSLLDPTNVKNPEYLLSDKTEELIFKKLDYYFEWSTLNALDTHKNEDYSGVCAFIAMLTGICRSKRDIDNKIPVLRIRHQESGVDGYFYSYAILNDCSLFGDENDFGWIVFLTCATDFSGHGGSMHERAEYYIEKYEKENKLSVKQIDVDEIRFKKYIKQKIDKHFEDDYDEDEDYGEKSTPSYLMNNNESIIGIQETDLKSDKVRDNRKKDTIFSHQFKIALSFSGKYRNIVEEIASGLTKKFGKGSIFYDDYYKEYLAQPDLDLLLQRIYKDNSELNVIFLSEDYESKEWCGIEFRAIRDLIKRRHSDKIMLLKTDDTDIKSLLSIDGYLDIRSMQAREIIEKISNRAEGIEEDIKPNSKLHYDMEVDICLLVFQGGENMLGLTGMNTGDRPITLNHWGFGLPNGNYIPGLPISSPGITNLPYKLLPGESVTVAMENARIAENLEDAGYPDTIRLRGYFQDQLKKQYDKMTEPFNFYLK